MMLLERNAASLYTRRSLGWTPAGLEGGAGGLGTGTGEGEVTRAASSSGISQYPGSTGSRQT